MRLPRDQWPSEWNIELLGTLCDIQIGRTPPRDNSNYWGGNHTWVSISDMREKVITTSRERITDLAIEHGRARLVKAGTLLMSFKLTIGKLAFAGEDLFTNEAIAALSIRDKFKETLLPDFLYYALQTIPLEKGAIFAVKGKTLNKKTMQVIPVPFPALDIQRRIVARIEALLAEVREMRTLNKEIQQNADNLMSATLHHMFPQSPMGNAAWDWVSLDQLGEVIGGGTPRKSVPEYWGGTTPWVSPKDMKVYFIEDTQDHVTDLGIENSAVKRIRPGSILIVFRSGILAHSLPIAINKREVTVNQDMKAISPSVDYIPEYIGYALRARARHFVNTCVKKGPTVHSIVADRFWNEKIPVPKGQDSLDRQHHIVAYLDGIQNEIQEMQNLQKNDEAFISNLEQAILHQAFRGEL